MLKIKKVIVDLMKKNVLFRKIVRWTSLHIHKFKYALCKKKYKLDDKTVLFEVFAGKSYACSPKAIYEEMLRLDQFKDYRFVWAFSDVDAHDIKKDPRTTIVKSKSKEYYKYCSIAKYWIVNFLLPEYITKKEGQMYVQCWHGTPLKKLRCDIETTNSALNSVKEIRKRNDRDAARFDYFISPSEFCTEKFTSAFNLKKLGKENILIEKGYPRNDRLFNYTKEEVDALKDKFNIPKDKKVILYAPTFRDNQHESGVGYTYSLNIDFDKLKEKLEKDYVIIFRTHYFVANSFDFEKYKGFIYNMSNHDDVNECYLLSDIILTDYSSVFFDFANLKRPMLFYMYDLDEYKDDMRGFYVDLNELPGPIVKTQEDLENEILNIDSYNEKYKEKYETFNKKFNYLDGNNCSKKVIEEIFKEEVKKDAEPIVWLFGENEGNTSNNNSYYMWEQVVDVKDEIEKYFVVSKTKNNVERISKLSKYKQEHVIWKNSAKHWKLYFAASMYWVSLSYKDVMPSKLLMLKTKMGPKKPIIYLQHGTLAIKKVGYTGNSYGNSMFRFMVYNEKIIPALKEYNEFKDYQLYKQIYHPRYKELLRISDEYKKNKTDDKKQILFFMTWREYFGNNKQTDEFITKIEKLLTNKKMQNYLVKNNYSIKLCLHQFFNETNKLNKLKKLSNVSVVTPKQVDVMYELATSDVLITDYSSVGFDFSFLNKPVVLYQPDLETYLKYRETYCTIDELKKYSVQSVEELINTIVEEKYKVNDFFRTRLPETIDYAYVRRGDHITKLYEDIRTIQRNDITFIGYNFFGRGGTVSATKALAEALLEKGYMVQLFSLKRTKSENIVMPSGLNATSAYGGPLSRKIELLKRLDRIKSHYSYLKYDCNKKYLIPYAGYALKRFLNKTTSNTIVSTRETLHLFLNDATSKHIKNKVYFFHTDANVADTMYPNLMPEVEKITLDKCAFVTNKNYEAYINNFKMDGIKEYAIVGNCLQSYNMVELDKIKCVGKKKVYTGITMLRMANDRAQDVEKIIEYAKYLRENNIKNIKIEVFGMGPLAESFASQIKEEKLEKYIEYCGFTDNPSEEIRKRDFLVDFSKHQSFGMTYIEGILNGKKVYATVTNGSKEVLKDIPNSYFETFEELTDMVNNLGNITTNELKENYKIISDNYSRECVANKFLKLIEGK